MRHPYRTVTLTIVAVGLLTGCSTRHAFQLLLTVKNADDGQPAEGAAAVLDMSAFREEKKQELDAGSAIGTTDAEGKPTHEFVVSGYTSSDGPWYLKLQKEGFEPQVIDISPKKSFSGRDKYPLPVTVELKPLPKKP